MIGRRVGPRREALLEDTGWPSRACPRGAEGVEWSEDPESRCLLKNQNYRDMAGDDGQRV